MLEDTFSCVETGLTYIDELGATLRVQCVMQGPAISEPTTLHQKEYRLLAKIDVFFRANRAQFYDARETALNYLFSRLYADVLHELPALRLAISNGDRDVANHLCDKLERAMRMQCKKRSA